MLYERFVLQRWFGWVLGDVFLCWRLHKYMEKVVSVVIEGEIMIGLEVSCSLNMENSNQRSSLQYHCVHYIVELKSI